MLIDEILAYLFDGQPHLLEQSLATWLASSRRFVTFATTFRDKIRKKVRTTQEPENILDLRLELETAYLLLQERSLSLVYEPLPPGQARAPDFAVTFTTSLTFMVEVTRLRAEAKESPVETDSSPSTVLASNAASAAPLVDERLADTICSKLGQLLPQHSNVLLIGAEALRLTQDDLRATMLYIQQRVEGNDADFLRRYRLRNRGDFFRHYQRLSEIIVRGPDWPATEPPIVWVNPQAKHSLPSKVRTVLYRSHGG
ncbi:MAG: hypothetical protein R3C14_43305 [Caldilineaceae bacterium]